MSNKDNLNKINDLFKNNKFLEALEIYEKIINNLNDVEMLILVKNICIENKLLSNKNKNVRNISYNLLEIVINNINIYGISLIIKDLLIVLDDFKIESKELILNLFKYICINKEIIIKDNLQSIIPVVSDQMISTKKQICDLSKEVMLLICKTSGNKDIEPFIEDIIKSVISPDDVVKCINDLA